MMSFIRPRLRKPAWTVLAGAVFAAEWVIRGGRIGGCGVSLVAVATAGRAFAVYALRRHVSAVRKPNLRQGRGKVLLYG
jgi:hypothetical protein